MLQRCNLNHIQLLKISLFKEELKILLSSFHVVGVEAANTKTRGWRRLKVFCFYYNYFFHCNCVSLLEFVIVIVIYIIIVFFCVIVLFM